MRLPTRLPRKRFVHLAFAVVAALATTIGASAAPGPVASKQAEAQRVLDQVRRLDSRLNRAAEAYNAANLELTRTRRALVENRRVLGFSRRNLRVAQERIAARVVALYTSSDSGSALEVMLGAANLDDLISRLDAAGRIAEQDTRVVGEVTTFKRSIEQRQAALERARAGQARAVAARASQRSLIARQLGERKRLLASVQAEVARLQAIERSRQLLLARRARARLAQAPPQPPPPSAPVGSTDTAPVTTSDAQPAPTAAPPPRYGGVVGIAMRYLGIPYRWGGASPSTGFDCSGFIMYVYAQIGVSLPHYTGAQYQLGTPVSRDELQPGDLVFFDGLGHAGIYIGANQFIHAPHTGDVVKISSISGWYAGTWVGGRRL